MKQCLFCHKEIIGDKRGKTYCTIYCYSKHKGEIEKIIKICRRCKRIYKTNEFGKLCSHECYALDRVTELNKYI